MSYRVEEKPKEPATRNECRHYWMIEGARSPTSRGVCKFCGVERQFHNSLPEFTYMGRHVRFFELSDLVDIEPDREPDDSELEESNVNS